MENSKIMPRYFDQNDITATPGINKIDDRKYYCYIDTNNTIVVIPNWYRWQGAIVVVVALVWGILLGWYFT